MTSAGFNPHFHSPVNAIRYVGAWPVFIDADPVYWEMDPQKVLDFIEKDCEWKASELRNRHTGRRYGRSCRCTSSGILWIWTRSWMRRKSTS